MTLTATWKQYTEWLRENAPDAFENLAPPATDAELEALEKAIGQTVSEELKELLRLNNGERDWAKCCALPGLVFLSTEKIADRWRVWEELRRDETPEALAELDKYATALDPGVRPLYTHRGWVPLFRDGDRSDFVGLDLAPADGGIIGQVINFGRDEEHHFVAFPRLVELIAFWLAEVKTGSCVVSPPEPPTFPYAWFAHDSNSIDVLREDRARRRG